MGEIVVVHVRRAVDILRAGVDTQVPGGAAASRVDDARARIAAYLERRCAEASGDRLVLPNARRIIAGAGVAPAFADGTTMDTLTALVRGVLTPATIVRPAPPPRDDFLVALRGHADPAGEKLRRTCLDTILAGGRATAADDARGAACAALLRLAGVLRPAALDLLHPHRALTWRDGKALIAHPSTLIGPVADHEATMHEVPLDDVTLVAWAACRAAGVEPRDNEGWLNGQGHSLRTLPAVARLRWRLQGLPDWLALHLTGEEPCVPARADSVALDQGWLPLLLRGVSEGTVTLPAARPRAQAGWLRGRLLCAGIIARVSRAARAPIRSPHTFRRGLAAVVAAESARIAGDAGRDGRDPPGTVARAIAARDPQGADLGLYTLLTYLGRTIDRPVVVPRRKRAGERAATSRARARRLRARSIAAYWQDGLAILTAMDGVPLQDWTPAALLRAFDPDLPFETHRRRARVLAHWARTTKGLVPFAVDWAAPPCMPRPRAQVVLSPGQIDLLLRTLRDAPHRPSRGGTTRDERAEELVVLASLIIIFRCRVHEAATRLYCDLAVDLGSLYIPAADAKGRRTTSRARGWLPGWAEDLLRAVRARAEERSGSAGTRLPLLPSARDHKALRRLIAALRYHLGRVGLTPHDLRHAGITVDIALAVALKGGEPAPALPAWARAHRAAADPILFAAQRAGHASPTTTATTYTHCASWALERFLEGHRDSLAHEPLPLPLAARLLGHNARWLTIRLIPAPATPSRDTITLADLTRVVSSL